MGVLDSLHVGDEILVHATVLDFTRDAWGPGTGDLIRVKIMTADAGDSETFASFWEPADALDFSYEDC